MFEGFDCRGDVDRSVRERQAVGRAVHDVRDVHAGQTGEPDARRVDRFAVDVDAVEIVNTELVCALQAGADVAPDVQQ
jgi:hypothetical protein